MAGAPLMRVGERVLLRDFGDRDSLHAHSQPRGVHHSEHAFHALGRRTLLARFRRRGFRPQPPGDRVVEIEHAGGVRLDAHLVSMPPQKTPLRAPVVPSSLTRNFGTMKKLTVARSS